MNMQDMLEMFGKDKEDQDKPRKVIKSFPATPDQRRRYEQLIKDTTKLTDDLAKLVSEYFDRFNEIRHRRAAFWIEIEQAQNNYGEMHYNETKHTIEIMESPFSTEREEKSGGAYKKLRALLDNE